MTTLHTLPATPPAKPVRSRPRLRTLPLLGAAAAITALALTLALPTAAQERPGAVLRCDSTTSFTLFGADTLRGDLLLRSAGGWLVSTRPEAVDAGGGGWSETAVYHPEPPGERVYGGSMGGGPIFAVRSCGDGCLQPVSWEAGAWQPLGGAISGVPSGIAHATYDLSGAPWLVVQQPSPRGEGPDDALISHAWHLVTDGAADEWVKAGSATVRSSGATAAVAAPDRRDAILSGTMRFSASEEPTAWLATLPSLPADEVGVLVPARKGAAYLTARGRLLLSRDGRRWVRSRWTPWGDHPTRLWSPGRDYSLDLPTGDRRGALHAIFVDRREPERQHLYLVTWEPEGKWSRVADLDADILTLNGERLDFSEIALAAPDTWVLLAGCVNTANGPGLVVRTVGSEGLTRPRFLPLRPGEAPVAP